MSLKRVLIIDDHSSFRSGIRKLLTRAAFEVVGEAENGQQGFELIENLQPEIVVLDVEMPTVDGPSLVQKIKQTSLETKIIILSQVDDHVRISQLARWGVDAHVLKTEGSSEILKAVQSVAEGGRYFSSRIAQKLFDLLGNHEKRSPTFSLVTEKQTDAPAISKRQMEVAHLVASGKTAREIAVLLSCSENTIKSHKANLMRKLGVRNSTELTAWVLSRRD